MQVGLMLAENRTPAMIVSGKLAPQRLVTRTVDLAQSIEVLTRMEHSDAPGIAVITDFF